MKSSTDREEPNRPKLLIDIELDKNVKSCTDKGAEPALIEDNLANPAIDSEEPRRTNDLNESALPH